MGTDHNAPDQNLPARVALAGSERTYPERAADKGAVDPDAQAEVTIIVKVRNADLDMARALEAASQPSMAARQYVSREELERLRGAGSGAMQNAITQVEQFAASQGLTVKHIDPATHAVTVAGNLKHLQQAFGVELRTFEENGHTFRARSGPIRLPAQVAPFIESVLGLDTRPAAASHGP